MWPPFDMYAIANDTGLGTSLIHSILPSAVVTTSAVNPAICRTRELRPSHATTRSAATISEPPSPSI